MTLALEEFALQLPTSYIIARNLMFIILSSAFKTLIAEENLSKTSGSTRTPVF